LKCNKSLQPTPEGVPAPSAVPFNAGAAELGRSTILTAKPFALTIWPLSVYFGSIYCFVGLILMHPAMEGK